MADDWGSHRREPLTQTSPGSGIRLHACAVLPRRIAAMTLHRKKFPNYRRLEDSLCANVLLTHAVPLREHRSGDSAPCSGLHFSTTVAADEESTGHDQQNYNAAHRIVDCREHRRGSYPARTSTRTFAPPAPCRAGAVPQIAVPFTGVRHRARGVSTDLLRP